MSISYFLRRLLWALPTLFGVAVVVFVLVRVVPGDPIAMMLPPGATADDVGRLRALYGLDAPIATQFVVWMGEVMRGNFGTSISLRDGVASLVLSRLPATLELVIVAVVAACVLAVSRGRGCRLFSRTLAGAGRRWRDRPGARDPGLPVGTAVRPGTRRAAAGPADLGTHRPDPGFRSG